jgi:hypothetical protein
MFLQASLLSKQEFIELEITKPIKETPNSKIYMIEVKKREKKNICGLLS